MPEPVILPIVEYARPIFEAQDPATAQERLAKLEAWVAENQEIMQKLQEASRGFKRLQETPGENMNLPGKITVGRVRGSDESQPIRIEIIDTQSSVVVAEARLTLENFALALTGLGHVECEIEWRGVDRIGKVREFKTELIPTPDNPWRTDPSRRTEENLRAHVAPWEVDGWKAHWQDLHNSNKYRHEEKAYEVSFVRFVDPA